MTGRPVEELACEMCWKEFSQDYRDRNHGKQWEYWTGVTEKTRDYFRGKAAAELKLWPDSPSPVPSLQGGR